MPDLATLRVTLEEVIEDWFRRVPLDRRHATRDGFRVGDSERLLGVRLADDTA